MSKSYKNIAKLALPLFILWPFGAFILSLFDIRKKMSAIVYILFTILYGFSFSFQDMSADSYRIAMVFTEFNYSSVNEIFSIFLIGGFSDLYLKVSYVFIKEFSNNPKILFAFFGLIFGVFSYNSFNLLVKERVRNNSFYLFLIAMFFFSLYPISAINGVRFNTAAIIFFVSVINIIVYNKRIWCIGLVASILIHFSYLVVVPIVLLIWLILPFARTSKKINNWVYNIFIVSFLITFFIPVNAIPLESILNFDMFSSSVGNKFDGYTSDKLTNVIANRSQTFFHTVSNTFNYFVKAYIFILILVIKKKTQDIYFNKGELKLFAFLLLFLSFSYFAASIPSGGRFLANAYMLFFYFFYQIYSKNTQEIWKKFIIGFLPIFSFQILFAIGYLSYMAVSPTLWYGNLFWILYEGIGFIKSF